MRPETSRRKCPPLSSFRVWCGLREDSEGLRLRPTAWEHDVIGQVRSEGKTDQGDPVRTWVFRDELH